MLYAAFTRFGRGSMFLVAALLSDEFASLLLLAIQPNNYLQTILCSLLKEVLKKAPRTAVYICC